MQSKRLLLPLFLAALFFLSSCKDKPITFLKANVPTLLPIDTWRATPIELESPRISEHMGKALLHNNYLFINEVLKGVHIYDNADPTNPINLGFLPIHANLEMVALGDFLYLDSYFDLLTFDISDINNPQLVDRQEDVFPFQLHRRFASFEDNLPSIAFDQTTHIVQGWSIGEITGETELDNTCEGVSCSLSSFTSVRGRGFNSTAMIGGPAKSGINSRMVRRQDYLYTLGESQLRIFQLPGIPLRQGEVSKDIRENSIQATDSNLWLGNHRYLTAYDLTNPTAPVTFSFLFDFSQCQPLVTDGNRAYRTTYSSSHCRPAVNQLHVMDISDLHSPDALKSYNMTHPEGLALDGNLLFVCEGEGGLKVYDRTDDLDLENHLMAHLTDIQPHDVYAENGLATITCDGVIYQYSYADPENLVMLSAIISGTISN